MEQLWGTWQLCLDGAPASTGQEETRDEAAEGQEEAHSWVGPEAGHVKAMRSGPCCCAAAVSSGAGPASARRHRRRARAAANDLGVLLHQRG